jgi:hypothetical protein
MTTTLLANAQKKGLLKKTILSRHQKIHYKSSDMSSKPLKLLNNARPGVIETDFEVRGLLFETSSRNQILTK